MNPIKKIIKNKDLAHHDHCNFLEEIEKMSLRAYDHVMRRAIIELVVKVNLHQIQKKKKLKKADELKPGWTGKVPRVELNFTKIFEETMGKYLDALRWILLGDAAGKEAAEAATLLHLEDFVIPGVVPSAYLNSLDTHMDHYEELFGKSPPELQKKLVTESLAFIKERTNRFLDQATVKLKNNMIESVNYLESQTNNANQAAVQAEAHERLKDGLSSKNAVRQAVDTVLSDTISSPAISGVLRQAVDMYRDDWDTVGRANISQASAVGTHQAVTEVFGRVDSDVKVAWFSFRDEKTCSFCKDASRRADGSFKIYSISDFQPAGTNFKLKRKDWILCVPPGHYRCFDDQTDVLTKRGWLRFYELNEDDEFLSTNLADGTAEWVKSNHLIVSRWDDKMVHFRNIHTDLMTTPNHNHVIRHRVKQKGRKDAGVWKIVGGEELGNHDFNFLATIPNWNGIDHEDIIIGERSYNADLFFEFMGYFLSEGNISKPDNGRWQIKISQVKHKAKMDACCDLLWGKTWKGKESTYIPLYDDESVAFFRHFGKSWEKHVPEFIKNSCVRQIRIFLDAYLLGDGSRKVNKKWKGYDFRDTLVYFTSSKTMSDDLSEMILKIGKRPKMTLSEAKLCHHENGDYLTKHPCWVIHENYRAYPNIDGIDVNLVDYNGMVYDVELEKLHTLFVRRNGRVMVSGNCRCNLIYVPKGFDVSDTGNLVPSKT